MSLHSIALLYYWNSSSWVLTVTAQPLTCGKAAICAVVSKELRVPPCHGESQLWGSADDREMDKNHNVLISEQKAESLSCPTLNPSASHAECPHQHHYRETRISRREFFVAVFPQEDQKVGFFVVFFFPRRLHQEASSVDKMLGKNAIVSSLSAVQQSLPCWHAPRLGIASRATEPAGLQLHGKMQHFKEIHLHKQHLCQAVPPPEESTSALLLMLRNRRVLF